MLQVAVKRAILQVPCQVETRAFASLGQKQHAFIIKSLVVKDLPIIGVSRATWQGVQKLDGMEVFDSMTRKRLRNLKSCVCCGYPISERHHLLPYARWGETEYAVQLCPNCHAAFHLVYRFIKENPPENSRTSMAVCALFGYWGRDDSKTQYIIKLAHHAIALEQAATQDGTLLFNAMLHIMKG